MTTPEPCPHHWLLGELADLPRDQGRCKLCGAVKTFTTMYAEVNYYATDRPELPAGERDIVSFMAENMREL